MSVPVLVRALSVAVAPTARGVDGSAGVGCSQPAPLGTGTLHLLYPLCANLFTTTGNFYLFNPLLCEHTFNLYDHAAALPSTAGAAGVESK